MPIPTHLKKTFTTLSVMMIKTLPGLLAFTILFYTDGKVYGDPSGNLPDDRHSKEGRAKLVIGLVIDHLVRGVNLKDAAISLKLWNEELGRLIGFTVESHIFSDLDAILHDFKEDRLDLVGMSSLNYMSIKDNIDHDLAYTAAQDGIKTHRYILIISKDSGMTGIKDLKGKEIALLKNDDLGQLFLNTLLLENREEEVRDFFSQVDPKDSYSSAVLSVFFKESHACLVTDNTFQAMSELNPQLRNQLGIIATSEDLLVSVSFYRVGYDKALRERLNKGILAAKDWIRGKQLLILFKVNEVMTVKAVDLDTIKRLIDRYHELKARDVR